MRKYMFVLLSIGLLAGGGIRAAQETDTYRPTATIKDIMIAMIDPSADYIWESVSTEISPAGIVQRAPKNDREWTQLRNRTLLLIEATNLLAMPGRHVAKAGDKSENPGVELPPEQIEALINMNRSSFNSFAHGLHDASIKMLAAVDARDIQGILQAGAGLTQPAKIVTNCFGTRPAAK